LNFTSRSVKEGEMKGKITNTGRMGDAYDIIAGKAVGKRPLRRCRQRCENNIKVYRKEMEWEVVDWMHLAQDRDQELAVVIAVMNIWVSFHDYCTTISCLKHVVYVILSVSNLAEEKFCVLKKISGMETLVCST
jgi:hypothetical protein